MEAKEDPNSDGTNSHRTFGLPTWMVSNIERLNFATDFEQYACSPPETEGFLTEGFESCDFSESPSPVISNERIGENSAFDFNVKGVPGSKSTPNLLAKATEKLAKMENMKMEEFFSSPDVTPCATPEPSPLTRRRLSGQHDSVRTNPGKWFYLGNFKKADSNSKESNLNVTNNHISKGKQMDKPNDPPTNVKAPVRKNGIKLVISNFDINAISPSSW